MAIEQEGEPAPAAVLAADVLISEADREVLLNDVMAGDLGIVILNARTGDWRLATDPSDRLRRSRERQSWS